MQGRFSPRRPRHALSDVVGILGGAFDPVHNGHLAVAALAREYFGLSKILFIPCGTPPHKPPSSASAADRLAMLRAALRNEPGSIVRDDEVRRGGVSYAVDTLKNLKREFPGNRFFYIVGSDNLQEIKTWHCWREILHLVTLCVARRPGFSCRIPSWIDASRVVFVPSPEWGVSSSMIRRYLADGHTCRHLLPEAVAEYIQKRNLYAIQPRNGT